MFIGGVITRKVFYMQKRCEELNKVLENLCKINNFIFIDNSNIHTGHLYDGVHLNDEGTSILANNYLDALKIEYNIN